MRTTTSVSFLVLAGLTTATLAGCSAGSQSVADACSTAQTVIADAQDEMAAVSADVTAGDFSKVTSAFDALGGKIGEAADKVTNTEVKSALAELSAQVGAFGALFDGVADGDLATFGEKAEEFQTTAADLQKAGTEIATLCNG